MGEKIAMVWMVALLMILPMGGVMAGDVAVSTDSNTSITCTVEQVPVIKAYGLNDADNHSKLNDMLDVGSEYHFYAVVNQSSGWDDMKYVNITAWIDNYNDASYGYDSVSGENLKFNISYNTETQQVTLNYGNLLNVHATDVIVDTYTHNISIYFTLDYQVRHAQPSAWNDGPGWNDAGSWNFRIAADSNGGTSTTGDEFGVYKYTYVSATGNPSATTAPGTDHTNPNNVMTPSTQLSFKTNDQFRIRVTIQDLTSGSNTLSASNVWVKTNNGDITEYTQFSGAGQPIYLYGTSTTYHGAYDDATEESDYTTWAIDVPLGTPVGSYTSPVTYTIEQP